MRTAYEGETRGPIQARGAPQASALGAVAGAARARQFADTTRDVSGVSLVWIDLDGIVRSWNRGAQALTGWQVSEVLGRPYAELFDDAAREAGVPGRMLACARQAGHVRDTCLRLRRDGGHWRGRSVVDVVRHSDGTLAGFAETTHPVEAQPAAQSTAVPADEAQFRGAARLELARARRFAEPLSLALLAVSGLREADVASMLEDWRGRLREIDLCTRVGDRRFAVLLPRAGKEPAFELVNALRQPVIAGVSVSGGLACVRAGGDLDLLWQQAEHALTRAQRLGNRILPWFE